MMWMNYAAVERSHKGSPLPPSWVTTKLAQFMRYIQKDKYQEIGMNLDHLGHGKPDFFCDNNLSNNNIADFKNIFFNDFIHPSIDL